MIPSLQTFALALTTPELSLTELAAARPAGLPGTCPALLRTTRFAETEIIWKNERWRLAMPLSAEAAAHARRISAAVRRLNSDCLVSCRLLSGELRWQDVRGELRRCDLLLEHIPAGYDFEEALRFVRRDTLLTGLDALQAELRRIGFAHRNLRPGNRRWSAGRFIPLRYYDARIGEGSDDEAFAALRRRIEEATGGEQVSAPLDETPRLRFEGHRQVGPLCEELVCVEDESGYGYVDAENRPVIAARYLWAADFREGRAEVQTARGMGLIDRPGAEVIPARYDIVEYDAAQSLVYVREGERWARFDRQGRQLTEFGPRADAFAAEQAPELLTRL